MHQERHYPGRVVGTDLRNPDFVAYARAFGAHGALVERSEDFARRARRGAGLRAPRARRAARRPAGHHPAPDARRDPGGRVVTRREVTVEGLAEPISHYADAVVAGDALYVSGIVPVDATGAVVGGDDVVAQARQVFAIMERVLAAAGATARRRRQGHRLPARRRRPPAHQPRAPGVLRLHAPREHAGRGQPPRRPRGAAGDRGRSRTCTGERDRDRGAASPPASSAPRRSWPTRWRASPRSPSSTRSSPSARSRRWPGRAPASAARWPASRCSSRTSSTRRACARPTPRRSTPTTSRSDSAPSVPRSRPQGAIVVGKANADEFAWGVCGQNTFYGDTVNPTAPDRVAGGSSSGNAAALAAGHGPAGARHRHRRLRADARRVLRRRRAQDGAAAPSRRGRLPAGGELRHRRPDGDAPWPTARWPTPCSPATPVPEPGAARPARRACSTAHPDLAPPDGAGRARRARAGPRRAAAGARRRRARARRCRCPRATRGRCSTPRPPRRHAATFPSRRDEYGPLIRAKLDHAHHGDRRAGARGPPGARGVARAGRARARRRPRARAHARLRRAAARRASTSSACGCPSRPTRAPSATWAGPRSRSATLQLAGRDAGGRHRRRAGAGARGRGALASSHARDPLHPREHPRL